MRANFPPFPSFLCGPQQTPKNPSTSPSPFPHIQVSKKKKVVEEKKRRKRRRKWNFFHHMFPQGKKKKKEGVSKPQEKNSLLSTAKRAPFPLEKERKENKCDKKVHRLSLLFGHGGGRAPHIKERGRRREKQPLFCEGTAATAEKK